MAVRAPEDRGPPRRMDRVSSGGIFVFTGRLLDPGSDDVDDRVVEFLGLTRLTTVEALAPRGRPVETMVDAVHGQECSMTGTLTVDDSRDQGMIVLVGNKVGLAPDGQRIALK